MKIPASIRIKNKVWKISRKWILKDDSGEQVDGLCEPDKRTLNIVHGLPPDDADYTFVHEFIHGVFTEYGLQHAVTKKLEEIIAHNLAKEILDNFALRLKKK